MNLISQQQIQELVTLVVRRFHPVKLYIFGSYAEGSPTVDSDVDLLVLNDSPVPRYRLMQLIRREIAETRIPTDVIVTDEQELMRFEQVPGHIFYDIRPHRKLLYER